MYNTANGYDAYREIGVKTASQGSLVVMLYNGAVSHIDEAVALIGEDNKVNARDMENFGKHLQKATDIISELEASLDMQKGGEIAQNLLALYIFFTKQIRADTFSHDKNDLLKIRKMLSDLSESWVQAANSMANTNVGIPADQSAISING